MQLLKRGYKMSKDIVRRNYNTPLAIREFRKLHCLTQRDIAMVLNLNYWTVVKAESQNEDQNLGSAARHIMRLVDRKALTIEDCMINGLGKNRGEIDTALLKRANRLEVAAKKVAHKKGVSIRKTKREQKRGDQELPSKPKLNF
jgi:DNA-binding transcriptional regulator YiaG